jgi:hypothetical protein
VHFAIDFRLVEVQLDTTHFLILDQESGLISPEEIGISFVLLPQINTLTMLLVAIVFQDTEALRPSGSYECKSFDVPEVNIIDDSAIVIAQKRISNT